GCVAQAESSVIFEKSDYVDIVVGPQAYHKLPSLIKNFNEKKIKTVETDLDVDEKFDVLKNIKNHSSKISSFVTIQEGCDKFCKFCVVPYTRGPEYSRDPKKIFDEISKLVDFGTREIVLLGQNVSAFKFEEINLAKLIKSIAKIKNLERIRFTTSHPNDFDDELISLFGDEPKLMPQLHLPVQSGSDKILKAMNRNHTKKNYLDLIDSFLKVRKDLQFSSDFIVGFPGETEEDFNETMDLVSSVKFTQSFSFIYSQRPGTPATNLDQLPSNVTQDRLVRLQDKLFGYQTAFNKKFIGNETNVLFENETKDKEQFFGRNEYMLPVFIKNIKVKSGEIHKILIKQSNKNNLFGELI
ncbi:MAG: tRNA (N6-isopentenyl adenosine(37)-C2)-methylthiotransferase MiaB, partial [Pelagibacteraceae bacterium]